MKRWPSRSGYGCHRSLLHAPGTEYDEPLGNTSEDEPRFPFHAPGTEYEEPLGSTSDEAFVSHPLLDGGMVWWVAVVVVWRFGGWCAGGGGVFRVVN